MLTQLNNDAQKYIYKANIWGKKKTICRHKLHKINIVDLSTYIFTAKRQDAHMNDSYSETNIVYL
jgi:hypothetical protein